MPPFERARLLTAVRRRCKLCGCVAIVATLVLSSCSRHRSRAIVAPVAIGRAEMRTVRRPHCIACGSSGTELYKDLPDRLFSAPGTWTIKRCDNKQCETLWLDPAPAPEDLGEIYSTYYTHDAPHFKPLSRAKIAYLQRTYGGDHINLGWVEKTLSMMFAMRVRRRMEVDDQVFHLRKTGGGAPSVLDVGCGSGQALMLLSRLGWQAVGVEFDEKAAEGARARGLDIRLGSVEQQAFPSDNFDAVTLSHVVEHLPEPMHTLQECHRILKPGGTLVLLTPNAVSLGNQVFGQDWRGLEPPRHLNVFSPFALALVVAQAGFHDIQSQASPSGADRILGTSADIRAARRKHALVAPTRTNKRVGRAMQILEMALSALGIQKGEQIMLKARKG
ncbi:class I SAM-dependent methyltransferase [Rhizobium sp. EC-SD404]|uniref:class I SAM-dependent methyltransferase n=1 Tax=Rhizobium sp. EC-SD404 TaxID=2038389 RepID=UPI0018FE84A3|nr:class I SAM-dependent methyltransferase [Rhizobium sp. EC-SD404]